MGYYFFNLRSFLSPRTSIGFHKKTEDNQVLVIKKIIFKEFSPLGSLNLQMRHTADFFFYKKWVSFYHASMQFVKHGV